MYRKILRDLGRRKLRTLLVVFSIAVGVFGVTAVRSLSGELSRGFNEKFSAGNPPDITVNANAIPAGSVERVRAHANVESVEARLTSFARWRPREASTSIQVVGLQTFGREDSLGKVSLVEGAFPNAGETIFEASSFRLHNLQPGQSVTLSSGAKETALTITGSGENFFLYPSEAAVGFATTFLNWDDAIALTGLADANMLFIKLRDFSDSEESVAELRAILATDGVVLRGLTVRDPENLPGDRIRETLDSFLGAFAIIALVTSAFLVVNTVVTVVAEQRAQIGTMKAVGATTGVVMRTYLFLALVYGVFGAALGLMLGVLGSYALLGLIGGSAGLEIEGIHVEPLALIQGGAFGLAVPLVAALLPVWRGARVTVRDAILSYGLVSNFGAGLTGRAARAVGFLPPIWTMAARNLLRNQMRVVLTVFALAAAGACIISVYNASNSLESSVREGVRTYNADVVVQLNESAPRDRIQALINGVSGVESSEGWFTASAQIGSNTALRATGLPADTSGYDITKVTSGRWFEPNEVGVVVITEEMARKQGYNLGDELSLTIGNDTTDRRVVGITRDLLSGESTFYAPLVDVTRAAGAPPDAVQTVLVRLSDTSRENVDRTSDALSEVLNTNGIAARNLIVYQIEENIIEGYDGLFVLQYIVVVIVTIVGALGLFGTLTMNIIERQREIGVLRAIGASNRKILSLFLVEGLMLGLAGWSLAVVLGFFGARWFGNLVSSLLLPLTVSVSIQSLVITLVVIMTVAFFATLLPSLGASRTRIAEILRYS